MARPGHVAVLAMAAILVIAVPLGAMPPLTDQQRTRLETAHDGRDHREEAFMALVENLRAWDGTIGNVPVRLEPDIDAKLNDPDRFRGEIVRLTGRVVQVTPLPAPHDGVLECFVRDERGRPMLVYLVPIAGGDAAHLRERSHIEIFARFYKRVDFTARDGQVRSYAAFVGAHPRTVASAGGGVTHLAIISIALPGLLIVMILLVLVIRRQRKAGARKPSARLATESVPPILDDTADLPDDPAEALKELKRRIDHADA
jgi:hypothetical protein